MTSMGNKEIMAANIEYYLSATNHTKKEMSEALDIPYTTIMDWVNARTYPRIDSIELMANFFGIQKADLVEKRTPAPTGKRAFLMDKISTATDKEIEKLAALWSVAEDEDLYNL